MILRKNLLPVSFKQQSAFMSNGNFPIDVEKKDKFPSCGNFNTSTRREEWGNHQGGNSKEAESSASSRFHHSPNDVKYNLERFAPGSTMMKNAIKELTSPSKQNGNHSRSGDLQQSSFSKFAEKTKVKKIPLNEDVPYKLINIQEVNSRENLSKNDLGVIDHKVSDDQGLDEEIADDDDEEDHPKIDSIASIYLKIKEDCLDQLLNKKVGKKPDEDSQEDKDFMGEIPQFSPKELIDASIKDKDSSILVQAYLKSISSEQLNQISKLFLEDIDSLTLNKYGNYVMQYLVEIHRPSLEKISKHCIANYLMYAQNEYGSRIMQKISTFSQEFCNLSIRLFSHDFDKLIKNITGSILLSKLIAVTKTEKEYEYVLNILEKNKEYLKKAYFNRMLSTLVNCCSDEMLDRVVNEIKSSIWVLMNDKFGNYVLQIMIERNHNGAIQKVKEICLKNYNIILVRKYPKFLLIKMTELEFSGEFCMNMISSVMEMEGDAIQGIFEKRESSMMFLLFLAKISPQMIVEICKRLKGFFKQNGGYHLPHCRLILH